jgi:hypothetical protein
MTGKPRDAAEQADDHQVDDIQAGGGTRTHDLPLTRRLLYQLSYSGGRVES